MFDTGLRPRGGAGAGCVIIGEIAQAHDGSLGTAHAYIDAAAAAGADAVKFQTHIASAESSPAEPWRVHFSPQDESRYDYWKRMEFSEEQWLGLKRHADDRGMLFLSSPFSVEAADLLLKIGVRAWKVASGEVNNALLFHRILDSALPVILSTGMSGWDEIDRAAAAIQARQIPLTILQCTSAYPCPPEKAGLNLLPVFRDRYRCGVGLSDHSGTIFAGLAAAAMGIEALEIHIVFSRECFGPDVAASLTTAEFKTLVNGIRFIETALRNPVDKDAAAIAMQPMRQVFTKSLAFRCPLARGTHLEERHLMARKPGNGIPVDRVPVLLGRTLRRDVEQGALMTEDDLADSP